MLEIPRNIRANIWKLVLGAVLVAFAVLLALFPTPRYEAIDNPGRWIPSVLFAAFGVPLIVSNTRILVTRPPWLRATSEGLWFGGGPTIPWQEIHAIYEAGMPINAYGYSGRTSAIGFAFHRKRTLFRVPSSLWLTTIAFGDVKISVLEAEEQPRALVFQLEAMRLKACGHEAGVIRGTTELPSARAVRRS